ncbi:MAG TPA: hypothetical protein VEF89_11240 [Solirubrobacteraceae bacterium]|nr:hypothetical protein [Solirubrobacteraceae bacterium]
MGKVIVMNGVTLDGVMQSAARPDGDTRDGFAYGGCATPYADDAAVAKMGERMGADRAWLFAPGVQASLPVLECVTTHTGVVMATYERARD